MNSLVVSTKQVADFFDVSRQTISNWAKAGCPKLGRGRFDLKAVFDWWNENINAGADDSDIQQVKLEYWRAKASIESLKEKEKRSKLIPVEEVREEFVGRLAVFRAGHQMLIDRLPPLLEGQDKATIKKILREELGRMFEQYRQGFAKGEYLDDGKEKTQAV